MGIAGAEVNKHKSCKTKLIFTVKYGNIHRLLGEIYKVIRVISNTKMPVPDLQQAYSIDVKNRYNLGYSDSDEETEEVQDLDPFDQLQKIEEEKARERELKKLSKSKPAAAAKKTQKKEPRAVLTKKDNEGQDKNSTKPNQDRRRPQGDRPNREYQKGNDENRRPPRRRFDNRREGGRREGDNAEQAPVLEGVAKPEGMPERSERYRGSRGGGRGGYRGRGGRREFDRRSGTGRGGVRPQDKRDGGGRGNWGTPGKEIDDATQEKTDEFGNWAEGEAGNAEGAERKEETPAAEGEERVAPQGEESKEELPEPEPEEIEISYAEWKAQQEKKDNPEFNIRVAGEGEDDARWASMKVVSKKSDEAKPVITTSESRKTQDRPKHVEMDIRFRSEQGPRGERGGRGRGGRGRGRGRGGRGGPRSEFNNSHEKRASAAPDVMNESEFPTLA